MENRIDISERQTESQKKLLNKWNSSYFFIALVAVASAVYFVFARNPLYAILSLIVTFLALLHYMFY